MKSFTTEIKPTTPADFSSDEFLSSGKGLFGGNVNRRQAKGGYRIPAGAYVLDPYGSEEERDAFAQFISQPGPLELEIGVGPGVFLESYAAEHNNARILGFEVRTKMCSAMITRLEKQEFNHVRIIQGDARAILAEFIPDNRVSVLHVNFPDPWWKKRHHKRRVFSPAFIGLAQRKLVEKGQVIARTDVQEYAQLICALFEAQGGFDFAKMEPGELPMTYREKQCALFGLPVERLRFTKTTQRTEGNSHDVS